MKKPTGSSGWGEHYDYFHRLVNLLPDLCPNRKHVPRKINQRSAQLSVLLVKE